MAVSYRQVCRAYPSGGGSYAVSKANFGRRASLVAAAALLIDYVMTVAVSTSSAVEQITSAVPELFDERVLIGVVAIGLITLGNLRGLRESGNIFAAPTYLFLGSALLMIAIGSFRIIVLGEHPGYQQDLIAQSGQTVETFGVLLLLRAFAAGSVALTGTEAIATGVQAFQPPEAKNAAATLAIMAVILGVLFIGITFLAVNFGVQPIEFPVQHTVISQVAGRIFGDGSIPFFLFQAFTALLLFLAANTSFNAFPRLAAILAEDGFMPRQFSFRGDRLAFSYGIVVLGTVAAALVALFHGETHLLIPLYAIGRLHRLHDQPGGHDPALADDPRARLAAAAGDQRHRLRPDVHGRDHRHDRQGAPVAARGGPDPAARRRDVVHSPSVRRPRAGAVRP